MGAADLIRTFNIEVDSLRWFFAWRPDEVPVLR
jgi:hypothetical protein